MIAWSVPVAELSVPSTPDRTAIVVAPIFPVSLAAPWGSTSRRV